MILESDARTGIYAYDLNGRRIATLIPEQSFKKGAYSWNKTLSFSSGLYFIAAKGIRLSKPLVLYK